MAATDTFANNQSGLESPYANGAAITPHDTDELPNVTRGIWVGGAGAVKVTTVKGDTITLAGALAGTIIPIRAKLVFSAGTTATNLVALY